MNSRAFLLLALGAGVIARPVGAQGNLSSQGYGFPSGQQSTRVRGTGGALGELDPASPLNPASLGAVGRSIIYLQYDPEFRTTNIPGVATGTTVFRFPLFAAALSLGSTSRGVLGIAASSFLDRTWAISDSALQTVGTDTATYRQVQSSSGGITDVRLAFGWRFTESFKAGIGVHAYVGGNQLRTTRTFNDSARYVPANLGANLRYWGKAVSIGVEWEPYSRLALGASYRAGGELDVSLADSTKLKSGHVPDRFGFSVRGDIAKGTQLSFGATWNKWTAMSPMLSNPAATQDAWDLGLGVETSGPVAFGLPTVIRGGLASRTLPFGVGSLGVREANAALGFGLLLGGGRSAIDFTLQRSQRTASGGLSESAWTASFGLIVSP